MKILLIEDDPAFGYILSEYLQLKQFEIQWVKNGEAGLRLAGKENFDLCLLDIMLPDSDGFEISEKLQKDFPELPFIFLTARSLKIDKLKGYRLGCDDYITKPVDEELLVAKIRAISRRRRGTLPAENQKVFEIGKFRFEAENQKLSSANGERILTEREAEVLAFLASRAGILVSRKEILREIWGSTDEFSRKSMDVFISRLRKYLKEDPEIRIRNVHGKGFILQSGG